MSSESQARLYLHTACSLLEQHHIEVSCLESIGLHVCTQEPEASPKVPDVLELKAVAGPCEGQDLSAAGQALVVGRTRASKVNSSSILRFDHASLLRAD